MRTFTIIHNNQNADVLKNIVDKLKLDQDDKLIIFKPERIKSVESNKISETIDVPAEIAESDSKFKNFVTKHFIDAGTKGFLHVFEDSIELLVDDQTAFFNSIEEMMKKLDLHLWFNTRCDECNYVFEKYDPRFKIVIDQPEMKKAYDKTIFWTSHANTKYVIYDLDTVTFDEAKFDEKFKIAMFYIIEFMARRRNNGLGFMNCYPSIEDEKGIFKSNSLKPDNNFDERAQLEAEEKTFRSMNIDHSATGNIDLVMDFIYQRLSRFVESKPMEDNQENKTTDKTEEQ